jgi:hypothetical protein
MQETYFTGEFGHLNLYTLKKLEDYNGPKIKIHTYPDFCHIIKNLFGDKYEVSEIPLNKFRLVGSCLESTPTINNLIKLSDIIGRDIELYNNPNIFKYDYISKQVTTTFFNPNITNFICLFPRLRESINNVDFSCRNMSMECCVNIIEKFNKKYNIVIVGNEKLNIDYQNFNNVIVSNNIDETVFYLKNCKFLISTCSGMVDFAKNCGTKLVFIYGLINNYHYFYNPFNTITINSNDLNLYDEHYTENNFEDFIKKLYLEKVISKDECIKQTSCIILKKFFKNIQDQNLMVINGSYNQNILSYKELNNLYYKHIKNLLYTDNIIHFQYLSKYNLVIISTDINKIEFTIKSALNLLDNSWNIIVVCNEFIINKLGKFKNLYPKIWIISQNSFEFLPDNLLLLNLEFWNLIKSEKIVIINDNSILLNKYDEIFDNYDFIKGDDNFDTGLGFPFIIKKNLMIHIINNFKNEITSDKSLVNNLKDIIIKYNLGTVSSDDIENIFCLKYHNNYSNNFISSNIHLRLDWLDILNNSIAKNIVEKF